MAPAWLPRLHSRCRKRQYLDTQQLCSAAGLQFLPLVAEACDGGWGPAAQRVWAALGSEMAVRTGDGAAAETERLLPALLLTLQREKARTVLRRLLPTENRPLPLPDP